MAKELQFSEEVKLCIEKAQRMAAEAYQSTVTTSHAFIATISVLKMLAERNGDPYIQYREKLLEIMGKYNFNGTKAKEAFDIMYPHGQKPTGNEKFKIECGVDLGHALDSLKKLSLRQKRGISLPDFIRELFSDTSYDVRRMIELATGSTQDTDSMSHEILDYFKMQAPQMESIKDFENVTELTNINQYVKENPQTFIGMERTIDQMRLALSCKNSNSAILVGKAGTGKTCGVYAFADAINKGQCKGFEGVLIYQLDLTATVSGSRYRGDFEEKLLNIINLVKKYKGKVILFIDEIQQIVSAGASSDSANDAGNILKPYISRNELQIIGATTLEEYSKYIEPDKALSRRFQKISILEPTKEQTKEILMGLKSEYDAYYGKTASEDLVDEVVDLADKYSVELANPSKAITIMDIAYAHSKIFNEKNELVMSDDALKAIQLKFNITVSANRAEDTKNALETKLLGQNNVLAKIENNLAYIEKGLIDPERPLFSAIFAGPTGVGKTEAARIIAKHFFGSENNLVKLNMGEYASEMDVSKINGSSAGYVGYDDEPDLVKSVKEKGSCVVLFDEIEKAHTKIFDTLLSILDTGEMKTNKGDLVSFKNCIIIFTTNLGYEAGFSKEQGLGFIQTKLKSDDILEEIKHHFRPEFFNRIDDVIVFNGLTNEVADELIDRYVKEYETASSMKFSINDEDRKEIRKEAEIEEYGARGLRRAVRKQLLKIAQREPETV